MTAGRYLVRSLGCKANAADGQLIEKELQDRGWSPARNDEVADLCIVNSCTVTDEADRQSRRLASRLFAKNPSATVVMTGCGAEVDPELMRSSRGVRYVVGNSDKPRLVELVLKEMAASKGDSESNSSVLGQVHGYEQMLSRHPEDREWPSAEAQFPEGVTLDEGQTLRTRSFLKIQDGCNSFCTYCVIPYGRGPSRSQPPEQVITQVRGLIEQGVREVVLTGTNIGDYGVDWDEGLPSGVSLLRLVRRILEETPLERLRLGSLDPTEIRDELVDLVVTSQERLCPHFHVSLQSPHSRVLRAMKRRYTFVEVERCLQRIQRTLPHAFVGMDVITGFPGETPEEFEQSCRMLDELPWSRLHVFPYSERRGTPATRLPGVVAPEERRRRARVLLEMSRRRLRGHYERRLFESRGVFDGVLMERLSKHPSVDRSEWVWPGHTRDYLKVLLPQGASTEGRRNTLLRVRAARLVEDFANHDYAIEVLEMTQD